MKTSVIIIEVGGCGGNKRAFDFVGRFVSNLTSFVWRLFIMLNLFCPHFSSRIFDAIWILIPPFIICHTSKSLFSIDSTVKFNEQKFNLILLHENQTKLLITLKHGGSRRRKNHVKLSIFVGRESNWWMMFAMSVLAPKCWWCRIQFDCSRCD